MSDYSACQLSASINLGCASNVGGIKKAYLVSGEITGVTYNASGEVTGFTASAGSEIYTYEVQKQTSSLTETFNSSLENGTLFYQQDVLLNFHKMDSQKRLQVKLMAQNRGLQGFVEDNNGTIYGVLGYDLSGGFLSAGNGVSGVAFGDANQYSITLSFFSKDPITILGDTLASLASAAGVVVNA